MKTLFFAVVLLLAFVTSYSQEHKTIINCWIDNGRVNYGHLPELLPDSLKGKLLADPKKSFSSRDGNLILLWLEQQGWNLSAVDVMADGSGGTTTSRSIYILTREIYLDEPARNLFFQKIEAIGNGHGH